MINLKPTIFKAISELVGGGISGADDGTLMVYHDGQPPPTEAVSTLKLTKSPTLQKLSALTVIKLLPEVVKGSAAMNTL